MGSTRCLRQVEAATTTTRLRQVCVFPIVLPFGRAQVVDRLLHGEHGAAWRRRQRRLRSWWRHELQSVALALSAAAHHSYDKVAAGEKYDGLRAQKTDRAGEAAHKAPRRQLVLMMLWMRLVMWFFAFPQHKKLRPRVEPIHAARLRRAHASRGCCASVGSGFRG